MSSDFSISEFRRRRAGDNPPQPETGQLPLDMPSPVQSGPQEFIPQQIPDAVPASPYPAQTYAPVAEIVQPAMSAVAVQPPAQPQMAAPPPLPMPMPSLTPETTQKTKKKSSSKGSKSLIGGLLSKLKKTPAPEMSKPMSGPQEFLASPAPQNYQATADEAPSTQPASLRAAIPARPAETEPVSPAKLKKGLPTWAAFLLGMMAGIILTFISLTLFANTAKNSLEARFSEMEEVVQSAGVTKEDVTAEPETPEKDSGASN